MDKLLFTPSEAAAVLGIGRSKVYELLSDGQLPSVRIDRCRHIPADELVALVCSKRKEERLRAGAPLTSAQYTPLPPGAG